MKLINSLVVASALAVCTTAARADFQVLFATFNSGNPTLGFVTDSDGVTPLGAGFSAQLYAGLNAGSLVAIGAATPFVNGNQGYINSTTVTTPSTTIFGGSVGAYQMKAWDNNGGAITSYEAAVAAGRKTGESAIVGLGGTVQTGGFTFGGVPNGGGAPITPPNVNLHPSFSVVIPEPSTIALGILGLSGLLLRRRRE
jgi:hypothetical protein